MTPCLRSVVLPGTMHYATMYEFRLDNYLRMHRKEVEGCRSLVADRGFDIEAQLLEVIRDLAAGEGQLGVKEIAECFAERFGADFDRPVTAKRIGGIIRRKLGLVPEKRHGVFVIPVGERGKLGRLYEKYGVESVSEMSKNAC
jgi:hypothetical protein